MNFIRDVVRIFSNKFALCEAKGVYLVPSIDQEVQEKFADIEGRQTARSVINTKDKDAM